MDGSSDAAEQVRRYPFTWTVLGHLFDRIPLFSLSRIFIERRFLSVVQQAAKDLATPHKQQPDADAMEVDGGHKAKKSKKRKRESLAAATFDLDKLRTPELCIKSAAELFGALSKLLSLLDAAPSQLAEEVTIGAEHVKSLFRMPASESREIVAPLLAICRRVPDVVGDSIPSEYVNWVQVSAHVWDLRAARKEDADEFAKYLFSICCTLMSKLGGLKSNEQSQHMNPVAHRWLGESTQLLMKNLVNPAKAAFSNSDNGNLIVLTVALAGAPGRDIATCTEVVWQLAVGTQHSDDPLAKKAFELWTQGVFAFLLKALEEAGAADKTIITHMLNTAITTKSSVESATTRRICTEYALKDGTDWPLVAKTVQCEPDLFVMDSELRATVLAQVKTVSRSDGPDSDAVVAETLVPLMQAYSRLRDLSGFVHTWHAQLAQVENESKDTLDKSVWTDSRLRDEFAQIMESSLSTTQVLNLIDWLDSQDAGPGALLIISDALTESVHQDDYAKAVGTKLVDMVIKKPVDRKFSADIRGLKFRLVRTTITWLSTDDVHQLWTDISSEVKKVLKKGTFAGADTFEAFKCISQFCLAMHPEGPDQAEVIKMGCPPVERLSAEVEDCNDLTTLPYFLDYVEVIRAQYAKLSQSPEYKASGLHTDIFQLLKALRRFLRSETQERTRITSILRSFVESEYDVVSHLFLDEILGDMDKASDVCPWTQDEFRTDLSLLLMFPIDYLSKECRKRVLSSWLKWKNQIADHFSSSAEYAGLVMSVLVHVSLQPTFYNVSYGCQHLG